MRIRGCRRGSVATSGRDVFPLDRRLRGLADPRRRPARPAHRPVRPPGLPRPAPARQPADAAVRRRQRQPHHAGRPRREGPAADSTSLLPPAPVRHPRPPTRWAASTSPSSKYGIQVRVGGVRAGTDPSLNAPPAAADRDAEFACPRTTWRTSTTSATTRSTAATSPATPAARASARRSTTCPPAEAAYHERLADMAAQITGPTCTRPTSC